MKLQKIEQKFEKDLHVSRYIIFYKFFLGLVEFLLGIGIIIFGKQFIGLYRSFKTQELFENPHDLLVSITEKIIPYIFTHRNSVVFILIFLGLIKIAGAVGLYYRKHWGLDLLIVLTIFLLPFDLYYFIIHPSLSRFLFLIINIFIALYLINFQPKEYFLKFKHRYGKRG